MDEQPSFGSQTGESLAITGSIIFLYSDCYNASKQFWGEDLALAVMEDKGAVIFFKLPWTGGSLAVVKQGVSAALDPPVSARQGEKDTVMVCLLTNDVDGWTKRIADRGHPVLQAPLNNDRFGIRNSLVRSPAGYLVEIQQFVHPQEQRRFTL